MIDAHTIDRLQAGAIIRPGATTALQIGACVVHVHTLSEFKLAQSRAAFAQMDIDPEGLGKAVQAAMADFLHDCVASITGLEDIDGAAVPVDFSHEPGVALSIAFCAEIIRDVTTLSNLTGGLAGKSDSLLPPSPMDGSAWRAADATASATPASKSSAIGQTCPKPKKRPTKATKRVTM